MKKLIITSLAVLFAFVSIGFASSKVLISSKKTDHKAAIANLLVGLNSDNYGLRTSCAFMLGELKASQAVIPLMKMLHSEKSDDARIVAALSLYKIGNPIGIFAVKQAGRFDDSERVRKMCSNFYVNFQQKETTSASDLFYGWL
jgi:HEAT repeat protein